MGYIAKSIILTTRMKKQQSHLIIVLEFPRCLAHTHGSISYILHWIFIQKLHFYAVSEIQQNIAYFH